jgi:hypothetical protein
MAGCEYQKARQSASNYRSKTLFLQEQYHSGGLEILRKTGDGHLENDYE